MIRRAGFSIAAISLVLLFGSTGCYSGQEQHRLRAEAAEVVVGIEELPDTLDPRIGTTASAFRLMQLLFNCLANQDSAGRVRPELAESWSVEAEAGAAEPRRWVVRLRKGVRFHDGRELTAADVAYTFRSLLSPELTSAKKAAFQAVERIETPSPLTVVFVLDRPQPSFIYNLPAVGIVPEGFPADGSAPPVGTGPFRYVGRAGDAGIELAANPDYYDGPPGVRSLILRAIPEETTRALELMHGSVDLVINDLPISAFEFLGKQPRLRALSAPGLGYEYIGINFNDPVLANPAVRKALAHGIDRESIIRHYLGGLARPAASPLIPSLWPGDTSFVEYEYDPDKAEGYLEEAGFGDPDGPGPQPRVSLSLKCSNQGRSRDLAVILRQQLARIGMEVNVRSLEFQTYYADINHGNFGLFQLRWVGIIDPDFFNTIFHSPSPPGFQGPKRGVRNRGDYGNPRTDRLIEAAEIESDPDRRWVIYVELQNLLNEELPYIHLWYRDNFAVMRSDLEGLELTVNASFAALRKLHYAK